MSRRRRRDAVTWGPTGMPDMRRRAEDNLAIVATSHPEFTEHIAVRDPEADVEDFWEPVARAAAAICAAESAHADFAVRSAAHPDGWTPEQMEQRLGPVATCEERRHGTDPLLLHPVLREHGGRWMALAGYSDVDGELDEAEDLVRLALVRARAGVRRAVVKLAERKTSVFPIELWPEMTAEDVTAQLFGQDLGWTFVRLAGRTGSMLLQDWIPMTHKYRLFVVDGEVVSGAGCIEEFTPYSRIAAACRFDARFRIHHGNGVAAEGNSAIVSDPALLERYLAVGRDIARQFGGTVALDLALSEDRIVVVELNTLPNAGLYASDPDAVYAALVRARDRGYSTYAWAEVGAAAAQ